jgi:hypothetical protein
MGQIVSEETTKIVGELQSIFPAGYEVDCRQDTYTQDYIIWITAGDAVQHSGSRSKNTGRTTGKGISGTP